MTTAAISFSGFPWLWPIVGVSAIAALLVIIGYVRGPARGAVAAVCAGLKLLGIATLAVCLLEPSWSRSRAKPGANFFALLADNSQGMQIKDGESESTRGEQMKSLLAKPQWQQTLSDTYSVRNYSFDGRLQNADDFSALDFNGTASALSTSLRALADRYRGQPLAGIMVFTDGNATDMTGAVDTAGLPPIYPVVLGSGNAPRDIALQKVAVTQSAFEDAPASIQADVLASGFRGEEIVVEVLNQAGQKVAEKKLKADKDEKALSFRFTLQPALHGVSFYTVRASPRFQNPANTNSASREATLANNTQAVAVNKGRGAYRILYVSGRPNWEYKFLNRAVAPDEQLQLVGLLRIARREPKFEFMGRRGESGNPLFRGFDRTEEDAERYDQPVLVRLNTRDELELKGGFPKTAEELYAYDAIMLDDLEAEFFSRDQMALVQRFVSERGGGLVMLGGAESFREGNYARTPIGDMLPVYLDRQADDGGVEPVKLELTRDGLVQPWLRLRGTESDERARVSTMPPFEVLNRSRDVKPGASVLATVAQSTSLRPALVMQRFGHGRTAALMVGDLWRWGLRDEAMHVDMAKAWRQMLRWLVTDVPARVELQATPKPGEPSITLQVTVRDKKFEPLDDVSVRVVVSSADKARQTNTVEVPAESVATQPGTFVTTYVPRSAGGYKAEALVVDSAGAEVGRSEVGWTSNPASEEFKSLKPNRALLEQLARQTGGEVIDADDLETFAKALPNKKAPVTETVTTPIWHTPPMFAFALLCFIGEWGVRRWKGLP